MAFWLISRLLMVRYLFIWKIFSYLQLYYFPVGLYVAFFPVLVYMVFGSCPHLSIGKSFYSRSIRHHNAIFLLHKGTVAVISLMTAEALSGIPLESIKLHTHNYNVKWNSSNMLSTSALSDDEDLIAEKAKLATTLTLFVGFFQVEH